jgi:plastocyanin
MAPPPAARALLLAAALAAAPALGVPALADLPALQATHHVHASGFAFGPSALSVAVGDAVEWHNHDLAVHTATDDAGAWTTGDIANGQARTLAFDAPGTHTYRCLYHPFMQGTLEVVAPNQAPSVSITTPAPGAVVGNTTTIAGQADDADGAVSKVEVRIDAGPWRLANGTTAWTFAWTTTEAADGAHTITARATDDDGAQTHAEVVVTVANPPRVAFTAPAEGAEVEGEVEVRGTASDPGGSVQRVEVRVDQGPWRAAQGTSEWTLAWDSREVPDGPHALEARSFDGALHSAVARRQVVVDNLHPDLVVLRVGAEGGLAAMQVEATVANQGDEDSPAFDVRLAYVAAGGNKTLGTVRVPALSVGANATVAVAWNTLGKVGNFTLLALADAAQEVEEHREDNNHGRGNACLPAGLAAMCLLPRIELVL